MFVDGDTRRRSNPGQDVYEMEANNERKRKEERKRVMATGMRTRR